MMGTPELADSERQMASHSMVGNASFGLVEECVRLCLKKGGQKVLSLKKYQKLEENATVKQQTYLLQKESVLLFQNVKMEAAKAVMTALLILQRTLNFF
jgi:hypothetical protein